MAELATPSAADIATSDAGAGKPSRPEKPDEVAFKEALEKARKALNDAQEAQKLSQSKVNEARPGNKDSPANKQQQELRAQLGEIRKKQGIIKDSRSGTQDKVKALDAQLKNKLNDQKAARARLPYKNTQEVDAEISKLEKQVDSGTMKLVDEKKALDEITKLRKARKQFPEIDKISEDIDKIKAQISELKKSSDSSESKTLSDEYNSITKQLDDIRAENDKKFQNVNLLRDNLTKARQHQETKYAELKALQDGYYQQKRAYQDYEREANKQRIAKRKAEQDKYFQEKRKAALAELIEEAKFPAYTEEIRACDSIIRLLEGTSSDINADAGPSKFAAVAQRTVDDSGFKGTRLSSKKEDDDDAYFIGSAGKKKGRKGKKGTVDETAVSKPKDISLLLQPGVSDLVAKTKVDPPAGAEDLPDFLAAVKEKRKFFQDDQQRKTNENIENAKTEFEKAEAAAESEGKVNGAKATNGSAVDEVAESLDKTTLKANDGPLETS